jgi:hypothetical protein
MRIQRNRHDSAEESFDVLVQLTLPITLILAFVVITKLTVSQKDYERIKRDCISTPIGILWSREKAALLSLQEQLLIQAVRDVYEAQATAIGIVHYEASLPASDQIVDRTLPPNFADITQALFDFAGTAPRRAAAERDMKERALVRYAALVKQELAEHVEFGEDKRELLTRIDPTNRPKLDKSVAGEMQAFLRKAADPQIALIGKWIDSKRATELSGTEIRKAWEDFVNARPEDKRSKSDYFVNLKVHSLATALSGLHAPLLEDSVNAVL